MAGGPVLHQQKQSSHVLQPNWNAGIKMTLMLSLLLL